MNHAAAVLSEQPPRERQRPARIDDIINQQDRTGWDLFDCGEGTRNVARLHRAVGHQLLFWRFRSTNKRSDERNPEPTWTRNHTPGNEHNKGGGLTLQALSVLLFWPFSFDADWTRHYHHFAS